MNRVAGEEQTGDPIFIAQHRLDHLDALEAIGIDGSSNMFGKRRLRLEADDCHILNGNGEFSMATARSTEKTLALAPLAFAQAIPAKSLTTRSVTTLAGVEGLEPPTPGFGDRCSSQLSYTPTEGACGGMHARQQRRYARQIGALQGRVTTQPRQFENPVRHAPCSLALDQRPRPQGAQP